MKQVTVPAVHIVPVGFEIDSVVIPVIVMRADKVWLMAERDPGRDQRRMARLISRINLVSLGISLWFGIHKNPY